MADPLTDPVTEQWVQGAAFPDGGCFGCGPANTEGLGLRSFTDGSTVTAVWEPRPVHQAVADVLCGGVIGTLLDCHAGAAVWWWIHQQYGAWPSSTVTPDADGGPTYLTAGYSIDLLRPTSIAAPVILRAEVSGHEDPQITVAGELESEGKVRATITAEFRQFRPR